jgi:hypothetical protein
MTAKPNLFEPTPPRPPFTSFGRSILSSLTVLCFCALGAATGKAATLADATLTSTPLSGSLFDYTITLNNIGTTPIETFWYAWIPGQDYLATRPTPQLPSGWTETITGGSAGDGFAIRWTTTSAPIAAGSSLNFEFSSTDTPAEIAGDSTFFPGTPVGTSFVYQGAPFSAGSDQFVVQSVPEPSSIATLATGLLFLACRTVTRRANS